MPDYLLSDSPKNDEIGIAILDDVADIITPYHTFKSTQLLGEVRSAYREKTKLDIFSKILEVVPAFAYDHPEMIAKFPNGVFTENAIFIPANIYEQIGGLKDENNFFYKEDNLSPMAFSLYLTEMIGHKYGVQFSNEDFKAILATTFENCHEHTLDSTLIKYQTITNNTKPDFISNSDLAQLCTKFDISSAKVIKEWDSDNYFIDNALSQSNTINNESHPFNKLKNLIKPVALEDINPKTTYKDFKTIYGMGVNPSAVYKSLATLESMNEQLLKNNPDIDTYISKLKDNIVPSIAYLNDKHFSLAFNNLKKQVEISQQQELSHAIRTNIATAFVNHDKLGESITTHQRDIVIGAVTDFDKLSYSPSLTFQNNKDRVRKEPNNKKGITKSKMK